MRILIDTNILFSALLFPKSKPSQALLHIADHHEIVLCDRNITELRDILTRKAFLCLSMEHPKCMTAAQFLEIEGMAD